MKRDHSKTFLTIACLLFAVVYPLWYSMLHPRSVMAGIIQAIIPAAVPTANKEGNGSKFQLFTGSDPATDDCAKFDVNHNLVTAGGACGIAGSTAFNTLTSGTNTSAAMVVGAGASLDFTSTGTINASGLQGKTALQGNGSLVQLSTGSTTTNDCVKFDANGNTVDAGAACGTGSGGVSITQGTFASLPATCTTNDVYYFTNSPYPEARCSSTNTWSYFLPWGGVSSYPGTVTGATTTLNGAINNSVTTLTLSSATGFPGSTPSNSCSCYVLGIDTEFFKVTAGFGTTSLTVARGFEESTAASHSNGATITQLNWQNLPQGNSNTIDQTNGGIFYLSPISAGNDRVLIQPTSSGTSWTIDAAMFIDMYSASFPSAGLVLYESGTTKCETFGFFQSGGVSIGTLFGTGATNCSVNLGTSQGLGLDKYYPAAKLMFFRIQRTGGNLIYFTSADYQHWRQMFSESETSHFTTAPDFIGIHAINGGAATYTVSANLISWFLH